MIEMFATILVVVPLSLVVFASICAVIAVFAKKKGLEFEISFQKFKKVNFFSLLADFSYCTKRLRFNFWLRALAPQSKE